MKRITVVCTYLEEGTKKIKQETMNIYSTDSKQETLQIRLDEVYTAYNNSRKHYEHKNFLQSFEVLKETDF